MKILGTLTKLVDESGTTKNGKDYLKVSAVIVSKTTEYGDEGMVVTFFGEKPVEQIKKAEEGDKIEVSLNFKISEYNSKYYTNIGGWKVDIIESAAKGENVAPF